MIQAIRTSDIAEGMMKTVVVNGHSIALSCIDGSFYAVQDLCSHAQCSFGTNGYLQGHTLVCGCHGASFDAMTGKVLSLPATANIHTYKTSVKDGWVYVSIKENI